MAPRPGIWAGWRRRLAAATTPRSTSSGPWSEMRRWERPSAWRAPSSITRKSWAPRDRAVRESWSRLLPRRRGSWVFPRCSGGQRRWAERRLGAGLEPGATLPGLMAKLLVIAEKPSVGRDLSKVLPGPFQKSEGFLEGPSHVVTWAVGHLVQLADPDEYDDRFKKWRMADLPIVPEHFRLVVRDERSKKQMNVVKRLLARDEVSSVVNACDAGREGELIFAYLFEKSGS